MEIQYENVFDWKDLWDIVTGEETLSKEGSQKRQQKMLDIYKGQKQGRSYSWSLLRINCNKEGSVISLKPTN